MEKIEDGEIVRSIAARGSDARAAEAELCRRFAPRAELYGRKHLGDADRAKDLAQAAMLAVLEAARAGRVEDPARIARFVLGTCRNIALRTREVDARARPTHDGILDVGVFTMPEMELIDAGALFRCVKALDPRDRAVVYLSFNEEKSSEEIAAVIETTPGHVRVLRHRAVAQLRLCLETCNADSAAPDDARRKGDDR